MKRVLLWAVKNYLEEKELASTHGHRNPCSLGCCSSSRTGPFTAKLQK